MPPQTETQTQKKKKGFGEKLKGVGKRIVQEAKKVPGTVYREGIKPYGQHLAEKFTETGTVTGRLIRDEPQAGTTAAPFEKGPKGFRTDPEGRARLRARNEAKRLAGGVSQPAPKAQTIAEMVAPVSREPKGATYPLAGGRTGAYDPSFKGSKGAVERLAEIRAKEAAAKGGKKTTERTTEQKIKDATKVTTEPALVEKTPATVGRTQSQRGALSRYKQPVYKAEATAEAIKEGPLPKITKEQRLIRAQKQRAGLMESRKGKGKPGKRKFSAKKTSATLNKAAKARREEMAKAMPPDTTAQEMARLMTEQDIAREAQRAETELKGGRKPQREKARYRYRTRGLKRSEGRGR